MTGCTCSQIDRAKAWAEKNGYYEAPNGAIYRGFTYRGKGTRPVAAGWNTFYVKFLYDIERDGCA